MPPKFPTVCQRLQPLLTFSRKISTFSSRPSETRFGGRGVTGVTAENTPPWVYVLVAIVRKRLELDASLYQNLQIISLPLFEKAPILWALHAPDFDNDLVDPGNQLNLFDFSRTLLMEQDRQF
jgi:hypothetical protein